MNYYSYTPHCGMQYHLTKAEAIAAVNDAIGICPLDERFHLPQATWGEVTERMVDTGAGYTLKRQERLTFETFFPQVVDGRMQDQEGNLILLKNIHESDLVEHDMVLSIACIWENVSGKIGRFKQYCFEDVTSFVDLLFEKWNAKRGGTEGNMSFSTIDRRFQLKISIQKTIDFGPEIQVAQSKLVSAIREMASEDSDIQSIVTSAFTLTDGKLNVAAILRLRRLKISNPTWNEGMEIIDAAIEVISKKKQIRLYRRNDQGQYGAIPLNIAAL